MIKRRVRYILLGCGIILWQLDTTAVAAFPNSFLVSSRKSCKSTDLVEGVVICQATMDEFRGEGEVRTTSSQSSDQDAVAKKNVEKNEKKGRTIDTSNNKRPREKERVSSVARKRQPVKEQPALIVPASGFNVVLTHVTADFDSLASAVGLAKLWSLNKEEGEGEVEDSGKGRKNFDSQSRVPTFVVLPRGAHPDVQRFLNLHKHLFPIRSLKSLPSDLSGLNRLGLVDAQRRDRVGPAENLLSKAKRVTIVDHHVDSASDISEATDYVVDKVGSVSTLICERLQDAKIALTEAEATLLALGIHADTGSLNYDSTTPRDAKALAWLLESGASQAAISEHAQASLSQEQQGVLTQALLNTNATKIHGVTISTVLLKADGFINGLATVTKDALELSSSEVFLLGLVYKPRSGGSRRSKKQQTANATQLPASLFSNALSVDDTHNTAKAWTSGKEALNRLKLQAAFERCDTDDSGYLEEDEITTALSNSGTILANDIVSNMVEMYDKDGDGRIDFDEFVALANDAKAWQEEQDRNGKGSQCSLIVIGRAKSGVNLKNVRLSHIMERYGGGGHPKAASTTVRLTNETEAARVMQTMVDELIETGLSKQPCVGDFMTAPVLSAKPHMTEKQVEDLFTRYNIRALPVVNDNNDVVGLVTYKEVAAAKQRLWNKQQKQLRQQQQRDAKKKDETSSRQAIPEKKLGSALKGWMKQHVTMIPASMTMAEVEAVLLENDVGCVPVVQDGTTQLVGMVTRTDLLRQHRYYSSLHYHNKGFSDSIAARKPMIELRKRLKKFDIE